MTGPTSSQPFDQSATGLWRRLLDREGGIDEGAWQRTCAEGGFVGYCRLCGGYLSPRRPDRHGTRVDYEAECVDCRQTICAPNGTVFRTSSRLRERS